jgi:RNA polymerase sigma factor (sigma-70 family)
MLSDINIIGSEEEFVAKLKQKDGPSFCSLYDKYSGALYCIILQIVFDRELANEVLQDVFVRIWGEMESYDSSKGRLFTWMSIIARNLAIDMIRSKYFHDTRKTETMPESKYFDKNEIGCCLDVNAIGLRKIVNMLKPQHRVLIDLAYFEGYTNLQIAEIEKIPLGTVKSGLRNALSQLKGYLGQKDSLVPEWVSS